MVLLAVFLGGCGSKNEAETKPAEAPAAPVSAPSQKTVDFSTAATLRGRVTFQGQAPEAGRIAVKGNPECAALHPGGAIASEELVTHDGLLANVFIYVKEGLEGYTFTPPALPLTIENKTCVYRPHVSGVMVGQPVDFLNQDSTLHNIHAYPKNSKPFNLGLPLVGMKQTKKFGAPEVMVGLKCDVHPWMQGYIGVVANPYFAVSDSSGEFLIRNIPPGEYTVEAWHEKLGVQAQKITVGASETKELEFKF